MTPQFSDMTSTSIFFDVFLFLLSSLVTGPSFMSISSLVLELWQFSFIRDWPEIRKSQISLSEFYPISGDWGELWILNLVRMSLIECYWMLQNSRVTAFTVFELLRENQLGSGSVKLPPLSQIRVNEIHLLVENKKKKTPFGGDILCHRLSCLFLFSFFFLFDILVCRLKFVHKSMVGSDETSWSIFKYFLNFALK